VCAYEERKCSTYSLFYIYIAPNRYKDPDLFTGRCPCNQLPRNIIIHDGKEALLLSILWYSLYQEAHNVLLAIQGQKLKTHGATDLWTLRVHYNNERLL